MWYFWTLLVVSCARAQAGAPVSSTEPPVPMVTAPAGAPDRQESSTALPAPVATPTPARTLDRQAAELAWRTWLQSAESGNQNSPPRRITTKSLFITPLVCPKGQRLDRNGCVQVVTVNKDEHERILLEELNRLFTSPPSGDLVYDYGDEELGPLQLSIPIGLDPQAAPLHGQEPNAQAQELQSDIIVDKKDEHKPYSDTNSVEAELELLKLQNHKNSNNDSALPHKNAIDNILSNFLPLQDNAKRNCLTLNDTTTEAPQNKTDEGQKEIVYGNVNTDPVVQNTDSAFQQTTESEIQQTTEIPTTVSDVTNESLPTQAEQNNATLINSTNNTNSNISSISSTSIQTFETISTNTADADTKMSKKDEIQNKLNPENDYSDIGEAIKIISRYADVTTDDNFDKEQRKSPEDKDRILDTRTKPQHRRKLPQLFQLRKKPLPMSYDESPKDDTLYKMYPKVEPYYRYPWSSQHTQTPPPDYPFRHLQDYWPDRKQIPGMYNMVHENPTRHHHEYPNYFRPQGYPVSGYGYPASYSGYHRQPQVYPYGMPEHRAMRPHNSDQDLYSLLGLRHWFSGEGTTDR